MHGKSNGFASVEYRRRARSFMFLPIRERERCVMTIGVIGAMDLEVASLKRSMKDAHTVVIAGSEFSGGTIEGAPVVVVQCGVGKVNAALCTQALIDEFNVSCVINTGAAGSLDERIDIGDIVVSTDAVQHDVDATLFGYEQGQVPGMKTVSFKADSALQEKATAAIATCGSGVSSFSGRVASGDTFVADPQKKAWIRDTFGACCCEMEGAAIAQVCARNNVPFVIMRAISDKADGSETEEYEVFERKAAIDCAQVVLCMVANFDEA